MARSGPILVATDFSPCSLQALSRAGQLAAHCGADLHVIHVVNSGGLGQIASSLPFSRKKFDEQMIHKTETRLQEAVQSVLGETPVKIHAAVGHPLDAVLRTIKKIDAHLLIIGAFGDGGPGRGASAFSAKCARRCPVNVLLVHESWPDSMQTVVACVDFSEFSDDVADKAANLAAFTGAKLKLIHVHSNPFDAFSGMLTDSHAPQDYEQYKHALQDQLDQIGERVASEHAGLAVESKLIFGADYARTIVEHAKEIDADLAVVGAKGRTNISYILLGSTTEKLLRETEISVLTVRQ